MVNIAKNCIYATKRRENGCAILNDDVTCDPQNCMWRHTEETYFQSLEKAMLNYEKRTGRKDYIDRFMKILGNSWKERFVIWLRKKNPAEII